MKMAKKHESLRSLAKRLGRSPSHVSRVMRGERVSKTLMEQIRKARVNHGR